MLTTKGSGRTEVDDSHENISIILIRIFDIAEAQDVELIVAIPSGGVNRQQNGPGDQAPKEEYRTKNPQES